MSWLNIVLFLAGWAGIGAGAYFMAGTKPVVFVGWMLVTLVGASLLVLSLCDLCALWGVC